MSLSAADLQIIPILGLFVVAAFIALLMDYLKSYNDQLRERNIDLAARQQERDRWFGNNPEVFFEKIATILRSAPGLPSPAAAAPGVSGVSARARHRAASYGQPAQAAAAVEEPEVDVTGEGPGLSEADLADAQNEIMERRPRARGRRDEARMESWVSKEELEKLAERAARIRARYGNMTLEEPAEEAVQPSANSPVPSALADESGILESHAEPIRQSAESHASQIEAAPAVAPFTEEAERLSPESAGDPYADASSHEGEGNANKWTFRATEPPAVEQTPSAASVYGTESASSAVEMEEPAHGEIAVSEPEYSHEAGHEQPQQSSYAAEYVPEEAAPVWDIPASPAQAAVSAAVSSWEDRSSVPAASAVQAPAGLSVVPTYPSSSTVLQDPSARQQARPETAAGPDPSQGGAQHEVDLDALFDQTYGSPSWLAMNGEQPASSADSVLPTGLFEGNEFGTLMAEAPAFTGVAVSIRINDFASVKPKLSSVEGVEAMSALSNLIRSLLREDRDFAGRSQEDEYILLFPGDTGDEGQRRLFHLSERLWDFQLRSLGGLALMLSWGGLEVEGQTVPEAVTAARDRLEESRRGRAKPGSTFRSARRVS